jgi:hypothetical protein
MSFTGFLCLVSRFTANRFVLSVVDILRLVGVVVHF